MSKTLSLSDIDATIQSRITKQAKEKTVIDGVKIVEVKNYITEDGSFTELLQLTPQAGVKGFEDFTVAQINRSVMLPATIKAWHLHYNQDEIWNVGPTTNVLLCLWDIREGSATKGKVMRIPISHNRLVFIPRGVAHGVANHSTHHAEVFYFVSTAYNREDPDEQRLPWDSLGKDFWDIQKE